MARRVGIVVPISEGSPYRFIRKLVKGIKREGYEVDLLSYNSWQFVKLLKRDIGFSKILNSYDAILYGGSIAFLTPIILDYMGDPLKLLFVHGYNFYDFFYTGVVYADSPLTALNSFSFFAWWEAIRRTNSIDYFVCHSITACEANRISNYIVLRQFVFEEELGSLLERAESRGFRGGGSLRVVAYTSSSPYSPRLLSLSSITRIFYLVSKRTGVKIVLTVIDPRVKEQTIAYGGLRLVLRRPMPRNEFLELLMNSHFYLERNLDEELGMASLEAGIVGTGVMKITLPAYLERQDYSHDDLLLASSIHELVERITELSRDIEEAVETYVDRFRRFIAEKRTWGIVKTDLLRVLG